MAETHGLEDYLEAIYVLSVESHDAIGARVADYLGVAPPTVTQTLQRMRRDGLVAPAQGRAIALTEKGLETAEMIIRRHRLAERWAVDYLGLDWIAAHHEASRLEHALSPEVERRLWENLGQPGTCPHGNPIPGFGPAARLDVRPLASVPDGETVLVDRIFEQLEGLEDALVFLGQHELRPGRTLTVASQSQGHTAVVTAAGSVEVPAMLARRILVCPA